MNSEMYNSPPSSQSVRAFLRALHGFIESDCSETALTYWQKQLLSEGLWEFGTYVRQFKKLPLTTRKSLLNSFSQGQIESKLWLFDILKDVVPQKKYTFSFAGGWSGLTALIGLWLYPNLFSGCESFDIDSRWEPLARLINEPYSWDGRFTAKTQDIYLYPAEAHWPDIYVNTICEHLKDFKRWYDGIPEGQFLVLQNNNLLSAHDHVNCVNSLQDFIIQAPMDLLFSGEIELFNYKRFMLIGVK